MRIAYIYTAILEVGGVDRILTQKANYLADEMWHDVYIITDSQQGRPPSFPLSSKVHLVDLDTDFNQQYHHILPVRAYYYFTLMRQYKRRLRKLLSDLRPDITITMLGRDMDFLTSIHDGSVKIGESHIAKEFCRNFHLMEQRGFPHRQIAHYWRRKQEKAVSRLSTLVLLTEHDRDSWGDVLKGQVIPNSVAFYPSDNSSLLQKRCITVGRYTEQKGYEYLIEAWKIVADKHPDWHIDCYGQGDSSAYQALARKNGVDKHVIFHGPTPSIMEEYLNSSIYVMSSRFEGFGLVLAEAMACGVPCVSFDCPYGPSDIISSGEDGFLVPHLDVQALADAVCHLIEDDELRKTMGQRAKQNVARYKQENVMQKWEELFERLIKK